MSNTLEQYRQVKTDYLKLRNQAKKELIARFNELAAELFQIQRELFEDFGEKISIPAKPKNTRGGKAVKQITAKSQAELEAAPSPQMTALQRQLEKARKKLAELQAAGKPTKAAEDRIYELEDALRLAQGK